jgi:hypothetical protein
LLLPSVWLFADHPFHDITVGRAPMNIVNDTRSTLEKHMPLLLGLLVAFLAGKALKKMFWTAFGMYWALRASGIHPFG